MSSLYRVHYQLRPHKRDIFIEFIKALLLPTFALRHQNAVQEYATIMESVEELITEYRASQFSPTRKKSRLYSLVPSVGVFFTHLPLRQAFCEYDNKYNVSKRKHVAPSFNDIRHILNIAQVHAIAPLLKLITFDGDQTLYGDGEDFTEDNPLLDSIINLLKLGLHVAVLTAAGYPEDPSRYEKRLFGLLSGLGKNNLTSAELSRFYVLGGECNYLFKCSKNSRVRLEAVEKKNFFLTKMESWTPEKVKKVVDISAEILMKATEELQIPVQIIKKERAVGLLRDESTQLSREILDECALRVRSALLQADLSIPFCAFNGGSDVWVDVGNKLIGVEGVKPESNLHVGDQFLSTGNDFLTRSACCTVWISNPQETANLLEILIEDLDNL